MNLSELHDIWKVDSKIDEFNLDESSIACARLHSKYIEFYSVFKLRLAKLEMEHDVLLKEKKLWLEGKLTREEIDERGWSYDPYSGLSKPLKTEINNWLKADPDVQAHKSKIIELQIGVDALKDIVSQITWRHQTIRNILDHRRFIAGG